MTPDMALAEPSVDSIVIGRGERSWPQLLNDFAQARLQRIYRDDAVQPDFFRLPRPNHTLTGPALGYNGWLTQVQTSQGCKFQCRFCAVPQFYKYRFAHRAIDDVVDEVAAAPSRHIFFVDDNMLNYPKYLEQLCERLRTTGKKWSAQVSMDIFHQRHLLRSMRQSGCYWIHVGIESLDPASLAAQNKNQNNVKNYLDTLNIIRDSGISISAGMVFGFPTESAGIFDRTAQFLNRASLNAVSFHYYTPFPGSPDHTALNAAGQLITRDLACYDTYHVVVRNKHYTPEVLKQNVEAMQSAFYRPRNIVKRVLRSMRHGHSGALGTLAGGSIGYHNFRKGLPLNP